MKSQKREVDPRGPVFISYRQSDGRATANQIAWALRTAGVPVWQDESDLLPGDTGRRLAEALRSGLSGAVLVVTPEIKDSYVVREVELPRLLTLEQDPAFTFAVASMIEDPDKPGSLAIDAPDQLLDQVPGTLARLLQYPAASQHDRASLASALCRRRVQQLRSDIERAGNVLAVDIQSRPAAPIMPDRDLTIRLRPADDGSRLPNLDALGDLVASIDYLPGIVGEARATSLAVSGGAHLSVAFAFGAALPTTLLSLVDVLDVDGKVWQFRTDVAGDSDALVAPVIPIGNNGRKGPVLVYVDLQFPESDSAYKALVNADRDRFAGVTQIRPVNEEKLNPADTTQLVEEISGHIRELASVHSTLDVHLLLRCPYPIAFHLGRSLNTFTCHLYEWADVDGKQRYHPSLAVRSGVGGSMASVIDDRSAGIKPPTLSLPPDLDKASSSLLLPDGSEDGLTLNGVVNSVDQLEAGSDEAADKPHRIELLSWIVGIASGLITVGAAIWGLIKLLT